MSSRFKAAGFVLVVLLVAALVIVSGVLPRLRARQVLAQETAHAAQPVVSVVLPQQQAPSQELVLPGNVQAFMDAPIYARTSGYLRHWYHDIGSHVKSGDLLAEIESPETDQQLQQAREELATARANLKLSEITAARYSDLLRTDSVAKQEVDNAVQDEAAKQTLVKSSEANVRRLEQLVAFERLYAPFDGVVTARNTDVGQLIASGPANTQARELFHVGSIDKLRVFINVPQAYSHEMKIGLKPDLTLPELPHQRFPGTLVRTADALDLQTRTLLVEVDVSNKTRMLMPNAYSEVHFRLRSQEPTLLLPAASILFRSEGLRVPLVVGENRVELRPVRLGRDFGRTVEVITGLNPHDHVIADPPDSLVDGELVRVVAPNKLDQPGAKAE